MSVKFKVQGTGDRIQVLGLGGRVEGTGLAVSGDCSFCIRVAAVVALGGP